MTVDELIDGLGRLAEGGHGKKVLFLLSESGRLNEAHHGPELEKLFLGGEETEVVVIS